VKGAQGGAWRGAELLTKHGSKTLVDAQGISDVSALREHAHQELIARLMERSPLHQLARRGLGGRPIVQLERSPRHDLGCIDSQVRELSPSRVDPRTIKPR
jgi:hypothetical protein